MNKLKHTPGPWVPIFGLPSEKIYGMGNGKVNIINTGGISRYRSVEGQANARLIAAAPEMLEALTFCFKEMHEEYTSDEGGGLRPYQEKQYYAIKSVIEKATGLTIEEILNEN